MLGVVGEQPVVKKLAGHRVQARVGLVEQCHLSACRQADHYAHGRPHPPRQPLDRPVGGQVELADQSLGQLRAPVGVEPRCRSQGVADLEVRERLVLADEHYPPQDGVVF